jgi:hypothetical protein
LVFSSAEREPTKKSFWSPLPKEKVRAHDKQQQRINKSKFYSFHFKYNVILGGCRNGGESRREVTFLEKIDEREKREIEYAAVLQELSSSLDEIFTEEYFADLI